VGAAAAAGEDFDPVVIDEPQRGEVISPG